MYIARKTMEILLYLLEKEKTLAAEIEAERVKQEYKIKQINLFKTMPRCFCLKNSCNKCTNGLT